MNEQGLFAVEPPQSDYTGKYQEGSYAKFSAVGYELFGRVFEVEPRSCQPYCIAVRPNEKLLISGIYWRREGDLTPVSPQEMPAPLPDDQNPRIG